MARCSCSGSTCNCLIVAGEGVNVTGSGTPTNPYVVASEVTDFASVFQVNDTVSVNLSMIGRGTVGDPLILSAVASQRLIDLSDVGDEFGPINGDVPVWVGGGTGHWEFQPPPTTPPGAVNTGPGLDGDGSIGDVLQVAVSGTWGVGPLSGLGSDSTVGLEVYIDSAGELRARPTATFGAVTWSDITGKPTTFPPTIGTTSTSAAAGNHTHQWLAITDKPTTFPPTIGTTSVTAAAGDHVHTGYAAMGPGATGRAVTDITGSNVMGLRWDGARVTAKVDATEFLLAHLSDISATNVRVATLENSRAVAADDINQARYARGTYKCHQQSVSAGTWYAVWVNGVGADYQFARNTSAAKFKENVRPWTGTAADVLAVTPVLFDRKPSTDDQVMPGRKDEFGLIADDVVKTLPELGIWLAPVGPDGEPTGAPEEIDGLRYDLLPVAQQVVLRDHDARIAALEEENLALRARLETLERLMTEMIERG